MKALTWHGKGSIRCETVPDPTIQHGRDAIIKVTACAICGSDLHLMGGFMPTMERGDILGHETMGEVMEAGRDNTKLKVGDRIVVPFTICCGACRQCKWGNWSCCERTNPNGKLQAETFGTRWPGCSASPTSPAASRVARPSTCGCPTPTSARSRSPMA